MKKIITVLIIGMFLSTIFWVFNPIENIKAAPPETPLDKSFIEEVTQVLTTIAGSTYWMGREYGSPGEREAAVRLEEKWNNNIAGGSIGDAILEEIDKEPKKEEGEGEDDDSDNKLEP